MNTIKSGTKMLRENVTPQIVYEFMNYWWLGSGYILILHFYTFLFPPSHAVDQHKLRFCMNCFNVWYHFSVRICEHPVTGETFTIFTCNNSFYGVCRTNNCQTTFIINLHFAPLYESVLLFTFSPNSVSSREISKNIFDSSYHHDNMCHDSCSTPPHTNCVTDRVPPLALSSHDDGNQLMVNIQSSLQRTQSSF